MSDRLTNRDVLRQRLEERNDIKLLNHNKLDTLNFQRNSYTTKKKIPIYNEYYTNPKMNLNLNTNHYNIDLRKPMNTNKSNKQVFSGCTRSQRNSDLINTRYEKLQNISNNKYKEYMNSSHVFNHIPIDTRQLHYDTNKIKPLN